MNFEDLYNRANAAGISAATKTEVQPMIVGHPTSIFGSDIDDARPTYFVESGVCGFAEVVVKPGNCRFANWLKKQKLASNRYYGGGVSIWVSEFGQ